MKQPRDLVLANELAGVTEELGNWVNGHDDLEETTWRGLGHRMPTRTPVPLHEAGATVAVSGYNVG